MEASKLLLCVCADNTEIADLYMQKPVTVPCDVIAVTMTTTCEGIEFWIDTFWLGERTLRLGQRQLCLFVSLIIRSSFVARE